MDVWYAEARLDAGSTLEGHFIHGLLCSSSLPAFSQSSQQVAQPGHAAAGYQEPEREYLAREEESWTPSSSVAHSINGSETAPQKYLL